MLREGGFSVTRFAIYAGLWCCLVLLVLSIRDIEGDWDHAACGVWGCSPPIAAVAACQAVWGLILFPISYWVSQRFSCRVSRITALTFLGTALLACLAILIYEFFHWFLYVSRENRKYFAHRLTLATLTQVDFPVLMLLLSGLYLRWKVRGGSTSQAEAIS